MKSRSEMDAITLRQFSILNRKLDEINKKLDFLCMNREKGQITIFDYMDCMTKEDPREYGDK